MVFGHIEKLKQQYTDQYVVVDATRPELKRFQGLTGQIKTVNMNGQALVQFDAWNNIGWYDIGLDFLKVIPKPEPKPVQQTVAEKAPKAAVHAKGAVIGKPAATVKDIEVPASKPGAAPRPSTADILAAARAKKGEAAAAEKPPAGKMSTAEILAAARAKNAAAAAAGAPADKPAPAAQKPSTAEILAAARAKQAAPPAEAAAPAVAEPDEVAVGEDVVQTSPAPPPTKSAAGPLPTTTADKVAWCRAHDAQ